MRKELLTLLYKRIEQCRDDLERWEDLYSLIPITFASLKSHVERMIMNKQMELNKLLKLEFILN
ncbi:MAG: hypothetical protein ACFFDF_00205 [Candidatus Odinarchaeota archaeon]